MPRLKPCARNGGGVRAVIVDTDALVFRLDMNLETTLPPDMWAAIRVNYEKGDFTAAIQDCGYYISELLRQKSGADGDGVPLVGQVLGAQTRKFVSQKIGASPSKIYKKALKVFCEVFTRL
jgi:hypothetical protein